MIIFGIWLLGHVLSYFRLLGTVYEEKEKELHSTYNYPYPLPARSWSKVWLDIKDFDWEIWILLVFSFIVSYFIFIILVWGYFIDKEKYFFNFSFKYLKLLYKTYYGNFAKAIKPLNSKL